MANVAKKKPLGGSSSGKRYLNTHYGKPIFGGSQGFAPTSRTGANPRAGMSYSVGIDGKGRVVHIYKDGERIVMHTHAAHAAPPHPNSFGGMAAPDEQVSPAASAYLQALHDNQAAAAHNQAALLAGQTVRPHPDDALTHQHQLALQAALAAFKSQSGA